MMNGENKRRIDAARDVLVGIIPDPKGQVEQITTALIYKYIDELDRGAVVAGGKRSFFTGKYAKFSWEKLMLPSLDGDQRLALYSEAVESLPQNDKLPQIFGEMLRGSHSQFRDARILNLFMKKIDDVECTHTEDLGDAYEHLLSIMGTQGDAGQFRTPRHIIDFIVAAIAPTKNDRILDPACGSAGFLVSAYNHIMDTNKRKLPGDGLTLREKRKLPENIVGRDIDPGMIRLALVNLYLHGIKNPRAQEYDTLSDNSLWHERHDVILANPPFMSPRGGIHPHNGFSIRANRSEILFVDYIAEHLSPQGRAGIIVPEGIVSSVNARAYIELRKMLVEQWGLYAVVSLPKGIFLPYSEVKTSVLFIDRTRKNYKNILFVKLQNDGFELSARRMQTDKNDIPNALKILRAWQDNKITSDLTLMVSKNKIVKNKDFSLIGDKYRQSTIRQDVKRPLVKLEDICKFVPGEKVKAGTPEYLEIGDINTAEKSYDISQKTKPTVAGAVRVPKNTMLISTVRPTRGAVAITQSDINVSSAFCRLQYDNKFVFYMLCDKQFFSFLKTRQVEGTYPTCKNADIMDYQIPLPPLVEQKRVVSEIENYEKVRKGARAVVENWKPAINIATDWKYVKLSDIAKIAKGKSITKQQTKQGAIPVIAGGRKPAYFHNQANRKGVTITISGSGAGAGYVNFYDVPIYASDCVTIQTCDSETNILFLYALLKTMQEEIYAFRSGMAQPHVYAKDIANFQVPCPSLAVQNKIASDILTEQQLVNQCSVLITAMDKKIAVVIKKIWDV